MKRILIIRHGALGDFCMATGIMKAVREANPDAHIALLTQPFLASVARGLGWFDEILVDNRSRSLLDIYRVCKRLIVDGRFEVVYDFQQTHRMRRLYRLMVAVLSGFSIEWRGFVRGGEPDLSSLHGQHVNFELLPERYALLIPGCSAKNAQKRWPPERYRVLTEWLAAEYGLKSVVMGTNAECEEIEAICDDNPYAVDFMGKSELADIPDLARGAAVVVGNDTGPSHMARLSGAKTLVLLNDASRHLEMDKPTMIGLCRPSVLDIHMDDVQAAIGRLIG